jgi:hypothetical protein
MAGMVAIALMIATVTLGLGGSQVAGQGQATQDPVVTPTPVVGSTSGQLQAPPAQTPQAQQAQPTPTTGTGQTTGPVAASAEGDTAVPVLAQGLIFLTGQDVVWQVREIELSGEETVTGNARVILQRSGTSVIRNDLTGKRARLEPGEAYFASADDPYTTFAEGGEPSVVWIFEIANNNDVGEGAFYLSPNVGGYGEAVYDFEFSRNVVASGETVQFEGGAGPSLMMVLSGTIDVTAADGTASLTAKDGLVVDAGASITATSSEAVYVTLTVGPEVSDTSAAPPAPADTPESSAPTQDGAADEETSDTTSAAPSGEPAQPSQETGEYVTSIKVGAVESVGITMYVDGELVFDGWLEPGQWTEWYTGTTFEVYTTSGANTQFQNTCGGEPFWMDFEPGETYYVLTASAESCAPV